MCVCGPLSVSSRFDIQSKLYPILSFFFQLTTSGDFEQQGYRSIHTRFQVSGIFAEPGVFTLSSIQDRIES